MKVVIAPVPGVIRNLSVKPNAEIKRGQILLYIEVLGMLQKIPSPVDGRIRLVLVQNGQQVREGALLMEVDPT
jgi:3-methylcrotonyl-CoA carboxylase alpha subunit